MIHNSFNLCWEPQEAAGQPCAGSSPVHLDQRVNSIISSVRQGTRSSSGECPSAAPLPGGPAGDDAAQSVRQPAANVQERPSVMPMSHAAEEPATTTPAAAAAEAGAADVQTPQAPLAGQQRGMPPGPQERGKQPPLPPPLMPPPLAAVPPHLRMPPPGLRQQNTGRQQQQQEQQQQLALALQQEAELEARSRPKAPRPTGQMPCCPRCNSPDTKFCYYNNHNVKQPRYYCRVSSSLAGWPGEGQQDRRCLCMWWRGLTAGSGLLDGALQLTAVSALFTVWVVVSRMHEGLLYSRLGHSLSDMCTTPATPPLARQPDASPLCLLLAPGLPALLDSRRRPAQCARGGGAPQECEAQGASPRRQDSSSSSRADAPALRANHRPPYRGGGPSARAAACATPHVPPVSSCWCRGLPLGAS
jgi:hypothetical protein